MARRKYTPAEYSEQTQLHCDGCGWRGAGPDGSERAPADYMPVRCPKCDRTIALVVPDPKPLVSAGSAYYSFFDGSPVSCQKCGWSGPGEDWSTEMNRGMDLFDIYCPSCGEKYGFLAFPTHDEVREAAAAGNERAIAALPDLDRREAFLERADESELTDAAELPDLEGDELELLWDFEPGPDGEDNVTVIRHGDRELWREVAYWEGGDRFAAVFTILRRRYGRRLIRLTPTPGSKGYLGGDHFTHAYRRAEQGFTDLDRVEGDAHLTLGSFVDEKGRRFQELRQGELVVWRSRGPSGAPTAADLEELREGMWRSYPGIGVQVSLES